MQAITESTTGSTTIAVITINHQQLGAATSCRHFLEDRASAAKGKQQNRRARQEGERPERVGGEEGRGEERTSAPVPMGAGSGEGGPLGYYMAWKPPNTWRRRGGGLGPPPSQSGASHAAAPDGGCSRWKK